MDTAVIGNNMKDLQEHLTENLAFLPLNRAKTTVLVRYFNKKK